MAAGPAKRCALVVEDDEDVRDLVADMLKAAGFDVSAPACGADGLRAAASDGYDVVVTDVLMPDVDGVEIVQAARRTRPDCRIVAISGGSARMPAVFGLRRTEAFGADAVLYKPFARAELLAAIEGRPPAV